MIPVEVEAAFTQRGNPQPKSLIWDGQKLAVTDMGRRWSEDDGFHMLVRVMDNRIFELAYNGVNWHGREVLKPPTFV